MFNFKKVLLSSAVFFLLFGFCAGYAYTFHESKVYASAPQLQRSDRLSDSSGPEPDAAGDAGTADLNTPAATSSIESGQNTTGGNAPAPSDAPALSGDKQDNSSGDAQQAAVPEAVKKATETWVSSKIAEARSQEKQSLALNKLKVSRGQNTLSEGNGTGTVTDEQKAIVAYAKQLLGIKYVWGGTAPDGFDCSGFVKYVYSQFGYSLNRVAADQALQGTEVSKKDLQPGDLVFFDTTGAHGYINHVGMYIGDGKFIQASSASSANKVVISDITEGFYANVFVTAKRFIN